MCGGTGREGGRAVGLYCVHLGSVLRIVKRHDRRPASNTARDMPRSCCGRSSAKSATHGRVDIHACNAAATCMRMPVCACAYM